MTEDPCKTLTDHLADRRDAGLVDIKFYIHNQSEATAAKVCAEAEAVFNAIACGAVEDARLT